MGGDHAPKEIVLGAMQAVGVYRDLQITLIGEEEGIRSHLTDDTNIEIIHTTEKIEADEEPVRAVRRKKNASMVIMTKEVKEGPADACISAGNTGALMTAGLFGVGRIEGVDRPALAPTLPTIGGEGFLLLDVGANVDGKPEHLLSNGLMGSIYVEKVRGVTRPRVGLLNVGAEEGKGNALSKQAFELLKKAPIDFIGNVEARDLLEGTADVVVCDGFTGNMVLKTIEGTAMSLFSMLKQELTASTASKIGAAMLKPRLKGLKSRLDYSEYGGAALFGLRAPVIKAHGSSDANAVFNAIRQARDMVEQQVISKIQEVTMEKR